MQKAVIDRNILSRADHLHLIEEGQGMPVLYQKGDIGIVLELEEVLSFGLEIELWSDGALYELGRINRGSKTLGKDDLRLCQ